MFEVWKEPTLGYYVVFEENGYEVAQDYPTQEPYPWDSTASSTKIFCADFGTKEEAWEYIDFVENDEAHYEY